VARVTEFAARLPSALCGLGMIWLLVRFGERSLGRHRGVVAGILLATAAEFPHLARRAQLDVMLTLFEWLAVACFWRLQRGTPRTRDLALLHAALGAAILTKGPVGALVPLLGFAVFLALERRWALLRMLLRPWALAISLGPGLVWFAVALQIGPHDLFHDAIVTNLFGRFFSGTSHARPFYYFGYQFSLQFLPWTLLWPLVAVVGVREVWGPDSNPMRRRAWRLLLCWVAVQFAFFSLSHGKRGLYLLPAFPAAALLCADAIVSTLSRRPTPPPWLARSLGGAAGAVAAAVAAAWLTGEVAGVVVPGEAAAVLGACAMGAIAAWRRAAAALTPPGQPIGLAFKRTLVGGLVYYGDRPVAVLEEPGAVAAFTRGGGRAIVVPEHRAAALGDRTRFELRARFRSGRRALLVVSPVVPPERDDAQRGASPSSSGGSAGAEAEAGDSPPGDEVTARPDPRSRPNPALNAAVSIPRVGAASAAHSSRTIEKSTIGVLNIASAIGTKSSQTDGLPATGGCVAPKNTVANAVTWSM
jgi:hypothetical protein